MNTKRLIAILAAAASATAISGAGIAGATQAPPLEPGQNQGPVVVGTTLEPGGPIVIDRCTLSPCRIRRSTPSPARTTPIPRRNARPRPHRGSAATTRSSASAAAT